MKRKWILFAGLFLLAGLLLAACGGTTAAPVANNSGQATSALSTTNSKTAGAFASQTVDGGNVAVKVMPLKMEPTAPLEFEIAMNTHSVDLADDMMKAVVLRDESGMEFTPSAWDGPGAGGHHREGKIRFAPLTMNTKTLTLVVKNVAGVPERSYTWELGQ